MKPRKPAFRETVFAVLLINVLQNVTAGPLKRSTRLVREVYPEIDPSEVDGNQAQVCIVGDVVYGIEEPVPADEPCLKCRCQPPGVQCETIKCVKKPGCKAIHKPNKCCPDYQCECHHEGRIYANGERLKTPPGGECKVCYCRGGEVQCADVSCYIRTDCEAKTVPGQCCPKYDHCPPKEPLMDRPTVNADRLLDANKQPLEVWPITRLLQNISDAATSTTRIIVNDNNIDEDNSTAANLIHTTDKKQIVIQEIIPEVKEYPVTEQSPQQLFVEEFRTSDQDSTINDVTDSEPDSSEILEVFQQPPPVLRIGDKLLFLKQGELVSEKDASTPTSVITIIGAEGLQRGFEDSGEVHGEHLLFNNSNDLELKTSESTHILSLVKRKKQTTTEEPPVSSTTSATDEVDNSTTTTTSEVEDEITTESLIQTTTVSSDKVVSEENPSYPPIPDVMRPENIDKILPEVLEIRANKTIPSNTSHGEWLKNEDSGNLVNVNASLPEEVLNHNISDSDEFETTTNDFTTVDMNSTSSVAFDRSMESIEETSSGESGENTTPSQQYNHESILSNENASVESITESNNNESTEVDDMLSTITVTKETSPSTVQDVELIIDNSTQSSAESITTDNALSDAEMITDKPERLIQKRENSREQEADEVFKQLQTELTADGTEKSLTEDEDRQESDRIFAELLEETSTPKSTKKLSKDEETLQTISDTIAKITLRGGERNSLDTGILGVISKFLGSQNPFSG